jgi:hypothetical protein
MSAREIPVPTVGGVPRPVQSGRTDTADAENRRPVRRDSTIEALSALQRLFEHAAPALAFRDISFDMPMEEVDTPLACLTKLQQRRKCCRARST